MVHGQHTRPQARSQADLHPAMESDIEYEEQIRATIAAQAARLCPGFRAGLFNICKTISAIQASLTSSESCFSVPFSPGRCARDSGPRLSETHFSPLKQY